MIRRPFYAMVGLGVGITLGVWAVRRVDRAREAMSPGQVAARANLQAGVLSQRIATAVAAGRAAAQTHEAELRAVYRTSRPGPSAAGGPDSQT